MRTYSKTLLLPRSNDWHCDFHKAPRYVLTKLTKPGKPSAVELGKEKATGTDWNPPQPPTIIRKEPKNG